MLSYVFGKISGHVIKNVGCQPPLDRVDVAYMYSTTLYFSRSGAKSLERLVMDASTPHNTIFTV